MYYKKVQENTHEVLNKIKKILDGMGNEKGVVEMRTDMWIRSYH